MPRHHRVPGGDEVRSGEELAHQLRGLADLRVGCDRVVPRGHLEVEPGGDHVLPEDRARASRHRQHERHAGDRAVLDALRSGRPHRRQAACLEVEHRESLRVAHQRLRAGAGGEAHLDAARRVGGAEKRLRPGRVVAVHEDGLGAVDRERLGVGDEPADGELEVPPLLDGALRHHPRAPGLGADEERDRVQRRIAGDSDRRLDLGEPAPSRLGRVRREQRGALLQVRDVRLVGGRPPRSELLQREHQLDGVEEADHAGELRGGEATREPDELGARHVDVHEHAGELSILDLHRFRRDLQVEPVSHEKAVDHVELGGVSSVEPRDDSVLDDELRHRVVRPAGGDEPELGQRRDQLLAMQLALLARGEPPATHRPGAPAPHRRLRPRARTRP